MQVQILRRSTIRAETARRPAVGGFLQGRCIRIPCPITLTVHPQAIIHGIRTFFTSYHARIACGTHVGGDACGGGVHVDGLLAEMGAGVGRAGVVGGEDGKFHVFVHCYVCAFDEPDVAGAEHALGGGDEVGAKGGEGREGRVDVRE